ncbi:MAG: ABC transporter ATP-binding protein [Bacteroidota bacterium]|nr:ABC transporter ATP-binding protein [Bacteroidota bacterium]
MSESIITVENLGKCYQIKHEGKQGYSMLRDEISKRIKGVFTKNTDPNRKIEDFWALKNVSFEIKEGEAVGIIGRNGAGKSTLLKLLSRITEPTTGRITLHGRVASLLEVGTGFHPELTGRENIYLNGAILGMSRNEITAKFDEIVDFSGVEQFLDTPVKRYSSGMYVRLAFAVAANLEQEILIIDEVLAVGDTEFQKKCLGKMDDVSKKEGRTVIFVSHQLGTISQLCNRSILLKAGQVAKQGDTNDVINAYLSGGNDGSTYIADYEKVKYKTAYIAQQRLVGEDGNSLSQITNHDAIILEISIVIAKWDAGLELSISLQNKSKGRIFTINKMVKDFMQVHEKARTIQLVIPPNTITPNNYSWVNSLHLPGVALVDVLWDECDFTIVDAGTEFARYEGIDYGVIMLNNYNFNIIN